VTNWAISTLVLTPLFNTSAKTKFEIAQRRFFAGFIKNSGNTII
jgi:hypothetical protein